MSAKQIDLDLITASARGWHKKVETLVKEGADIEFNWEAGQTPMTVAIKSRKLQSVATLIRLGAKINAFIPGTGITLLMRAANYGGDEIVRELIKSGAHINKRSTEGQTALFFASSRAVAETLIKAGIDVNAKAERDTLGVNQGMTVYDFAEQWLPDEVAEAIKKEINRLKKLAFEKELGDGLATPKGKNKSKLRP